MVVRGVRPVCGADLDQPRSASGHDIRDPETPANFDQFAARDYRLAAVGACVERKDQGGSAIVDDQRVFSARQLAQESSAVHVPGSPRARLQVVLEVGRAAGRVQHRVDRALGERCAAEVGVQDDAGGVDDRPKRGELQRRCLGLDRDRPAIVIHGRGGHVPPGTVDDSPSRIRQYGVRNPVAERADQGPVEECPNCGKGASWICHVQRNGTMPNKR